MHCFKTMYTSTALSWVCDLGKAGYTFDKYNTMTLFVAVLYLTEDTFCIFKLHLGFYDLSFSVILIKFPFSFCTCFMLLFYPGLANWWLTSHVYLYYN